jgi:hypothetical protein
MRPRSINPVQVTADLEDCVLLASVLGYGVYMSSSLDLQRFILMYIWEMKLRSWTCPELTV